MKQFLKDCVSIEERIRKEFEDKIDSFLQKKNCDVKKIKKKKYFLSSWLLNRFLVERIYEKFLLSSTETKKKIVENLKEAIKKLDELNLNRYWRKKLLEAPMESWEFEHFLNLFTFFYAAQKVTPFSNGQNIKAPIEKYKQSLKLFENRVEINDSYKIFYMHPNEKFNESSISAFFSAILGEITGIFNYCKSNVTSLNKTEIEKWEQNISKDYKISIPPKFGKSISQQSTANQVNQNTSTSATPESNWKLIFGFTLIISGTLCIIVVVGIILYKKRISKTSE